VSCTPKVFSGVPISAKKHDIANHVFFAVTFLTLEIFIQQFTDFFGCHWRNFCVHTPVLCLCSCLCPYPCLYLLYIRIHIHVPVCVRVPVRFPVPVLSFFRVSVRVPVNVPVRLRVPVKVSLHVPASLWIC
jgi:hypothetical protein